jgi:hypothetical protein
MAEGERMNPAEFCPGKRDEKPDKTRWQTTFPREEGRTCLPGGKQPKTADGTMELVPREAGETFLSGLFRERKSKDWEEKGIKRDNWGQKSWKDEEIWLSGSFGGLSIRGANKESKQGKGRLSGPLRGLSEDVLGRFSTVSLRSEQRTNRERGSK